MLSLVSDDLLADTYDYPGRFGPIVDGMQGIVTASDAANLEPPAIDGDPAAISVNGSEAHLPTDPRVSLLDFVREHLGLYGTKKGCDQGACGACTMLVDGQRILSCLALAVQYGGREVTTIEGLAGPGAPHPLLEAFVDHEGLQCGYCTPGHICSAVGMAQEVARCVPSHATKDLAAGEIGLSRDEVRERMSGNLCRCGAHDGILKAISEVFEVVKP